MTDKLQPKFERVMIIDDDITDLYITKRMIIINNFSKDVLEYSDALAALKYLQSHQDNIKLLPQIIFIDIYMPQMSGFEFLEAYEKLPAAVNKHCQSFIISSTIDDKEIERARLDKNLTAFQVKPLTKEFLDRIVTDEKILL